MSISIVIPPYAEPVDLIEGKGYIKQNLEITDDDALIQARIAAARNMTETDTGANSRRSRVMLATTFDLVLDCFPWGANYLSAPYSYLAVPRVPLISVGSISYVDTGGTTQTWDSSLYTVDAANGRIHLVYNESWPSTRYQPNAITVRFVAGMAAPFTAVPATDILTVKGRSFTIGDRVRVLNSGGQLPTPLQANTDYFVIEGPKLSLTAGGAEVDVTGAGSGTHYIASLADMAGFQTLQTAVLQKLAMLYRHRGDGGISAAEYNAAERLYEHCIASEHA